MAVLPWLLLALIAGAFAYSVLVLVGVRSYLRVRPPALREPEPISILKPLSGLDDGLEENLRSFFCQDYPDYELIFAVRHADDPAVEVVGKVRDAHPGIPARLVVTGEPPYANAKVYALERMLAEARHDLLVMADSDTRVGSDLLQVIASEFRDGQIGLVTCPYRGVAGGSFWSELEALGMNVEFLAGLLVARIVEGVDFGVGPTMAVRRQAVEKFGGFGRLKNYLAEDFVMGKLIAEAGYRNMLSSYVIEHRIGAKPFIGNCGHRLRWVRSTRRSRPAGYVGQLFTYPLPLAVLLWAVHPAWWPAAAATIALRAAAAWATSVLVLRARLCTKEWVLLPVQDCLSFVFWVLGFYGSKVRWRGQWYRLNPDGTFEPVGKKT